MQSALPLNSPQICSLTRSWPPCPLFCPLHQGGPTTLLHEKLPGGPHCITLTHLRVQLWLGSLQPNLLPFFSMPAMPTQEKFPKYAMISPTSRPLLLPSASYALAPSLPRRVLLIHPSSTAVFLEASLMLAEVSVRFAMDGSPRPLASRFCAPGSQCRMSVKLKSKKNTLVHLPGLQSSCRGVEVPEVEKEEGEILLSEPDHYEIGF